MMGWYGDGMGTGGWLVMSLVMLAFWALVITAVVAIFRGVGRDNSTNRPAATSSRKPKDILDERFARGEIDEAEYRRSRDLLGQG